MAKLRIIGDVHQDYNSYLKLIRDCDYSIQVGDLGMTYGYLKDKVDPVRHRAIAGNHDNYERGSPEYFAKQPIFLGDYGIHSVPGFMDVFYVRGAWSIDQNWRKEKQERTGVASWWQEEELSYKDLEKAIELYKEVKPDFVITHEAPESIVQYVTNPKFCETFGFPAGTIKTRTNQALQVMFDFYQPKHTWLHGHYHTKLDHVVNGTRFICLDMTDKTPDNRNAYFDLST